MDTLNAAPVRAVPLCALLMITQLLACGSGVIEIGTQLDVNGSLTSGQGAFNAAADVPISLDTASRFSGMVRHPAHVEIWNLGAIPSGTRLDIQVDGHGQNFSLAIFDGVQQVRVLNHDRDGLNPGASLTVVEPMTVYLAVSSDVSAASSGPYDVIIQPTRAADLPDPQVQHVVLNFDGAAGVRVGNTNPIDIAPFNAADLHPEWGPLTAAMKQIVVEHLHRVYTGLDVEFHFPSDPDLPPDDELTWLHFGGSHASNVGLADRIDYGNRNRREKAVVYTHNFAKYVRFGYTAEQLASGFANVAAHELGHLLGMNHTDDTRDVMNVSPTVDALVAPKYFVSTARLDSRVFPLGFQDGARGILNNVGGEWTLVEAARRDSAAAYAQADVSAGRGAFAAAGGPLVLTAGSACSHAPAADGPEQE